MEAVRDFIAVEDSGRGIAPAGPSGVAGVQGVDTALALVREAASTAAGDAALWDFREAADFAGTVEELSRALDYLQLVAAGAVDRTRKQATAAPKANTAWTTGWRDDSAYGTAGPDDASGAVAADGETAWATGWRDDSGHGSTRPDDASGAVAASGSEGAAGGQRVRRVAAGGVAAPLAVDDGYRNTTEFLRARLRISAAEARRRLALAGDLLPRQGFSGDPLPPAREELGAAVAAGEVSSRAATIITLALDRVRHTCDPEAAAGMEHALTRTAAENDPDLLARVARNWTDALDQDGAEPTEELLRQLQGAFIRKPRHGLQHLEIFATAEQFEHLLTVMNTATNPRTTHTGTRAAPETPAGGPEARQPARVPPVPTGPHADNDRRRVRWTSARSRRNAWTASSAPAKSPSPPAPSPQPEGSARRSWSPSTTATSSPASEHITGDADLPGNSPDDTTAGATAVPSDPTHRWRTPARCSSPDPSPPPRSGRSPATPTSSRSCSAAKAGSWTSDAPPASSRPTSAKPSPPATKAAPSPAAPSPPPGAKPTTSPTGPAADTTGTENGTLLCSHHHHVIHKEQWTIQIRTGIPWFIPPPHIDPRQKPRRNYYFHPADLTTAA